MPFLRIIYCHYLLYKTLCIQFTYYIVYKYRILKVNCTKNVFISSKYWDWISEGGAHCVSVVSSRMGWWFSARRTDTRRSMWPLSSTSLSNAQDQDHGLLFWKDKALTGQFFFFNLMCALRSKQKENLSAVFVASETKTPLSFWPKKQINLSTLFVLFSSSCFILSP